MGLVFISTACNLLYIGETGRHLGDRFRDHLYDIRKQDLTKPVSHHFELNLNAMQSSSKLILILL